MDYELELTKANRLKIARAFRFNKRVDFSIECAIEGQLGKVFVDDPVQPTAYRLTVGPFWYFAGEAHSPGGRQLMQALPPYNILMPSPESWLELAKELYSDDLKSFTRYSFSASQLSADHLSGLLANSPQRVVPIDAALATQLSQQPDSYFDLSDFDSVADFIERGFGFAALADDKVMGVAYSSLVCSQGIEVSVFVEDAYHRQGVATALGSHLLLECLKYDLRPNWDAANPESVGLAKKLGYVYLDSYEAYYYTKK